MAAIEFKHAVGKVYFNGGFTEDGKIIKKAKTYRNVTETVTADDLHKALTQLALLSEMPFLGAEKVETSDIN